MAPLPPRPGHRLLRCPICRLDLAIAAGAFACRNRHSFDVAREGYVNLLSGNRRRPAEGSDCPEQLRCRRAFLDAGHFDFIATTIAEQLCQGDAGAADDRRYVLDAGCGTGHHLARIAAVFGRETTGLGLDISTAAVRLAAHRWPDTAFAVVDLWADWPVHDASLDLVINIFAPRNFAETSRVLRPGGWLALVYPGPNHLVELRHRYRSLGQHEGKATHYAHAANRVIGPVVGRRIVRHTVLDAGTVRDVVSMGPNARHPVVSTLAAATEPVAATFDIALLLAHKRRTPSVQSRARRKGRHRFRAP